MTFMTSLLFRGFLVVLLSDPETGADKRTKVNRTKSIESKSSVDRLAVMPGEI